MGEIMSAPVYQALNLLSGGAVCVGSDGYARKAADTAGFQTLGVCDGGADNSDGASGDIDVKCRAGVALLCVIASCAITDFDAPVYWTDDQTVAKSGTSNAILAGRICGIEDSTHCWVRLSTPGAFSDLSSVATLTDNSGGAAADGTIGAITAPTAITNSSGSAASNGTIEAVTAPTSLTDNGGGTADGTVQAQNTFAASVGWNGSSVYPSAADEAALTAIALAARNNFKEFTARQAENRTAIIALTDALGEFATAQTANRTAIIALKDAVAELATKVNEIINA